MKNKLGDTWGKGGMVTPLVDVVFNLMITMFIFLMIYMAVVVPTPDRERRPLEFLTSNLPPAAPYVEYFAGIPVGHGSGQFTYLHATPLGTNDGVLALGDNGAVQAHFLGSPAPATAAPRIVPIQVTVIDQQHRVQAPAAMVAPLTTRTGIVQVLFHQEWPSNGLAQLKELAPGSTPSSNELGSRVVGHYAVRREFNLQVKPRGIPFDPGQDPLRLGATQHVTGVAGFPLSIPLGPLGGIEPYEFNSRGTPGWLKLDPRRAIFTGVPPEPGRYSFTVQVKDAQTPPGAWATAEQLKEAPGRPLVSAAVAIEIEPYHPLEVSFSLPPFGRVGQPFWGASLATGGSGRKRFEAVRLPAGLAINPDTGAISGTPTERGTDAIEIRVRDDTTNLVLRSAAAQWRGIIDPLPATAILGGNPP